MRGLTSYFGKKLSDGDKHMINRAFFYHRLTAGFFGFLGGVASYAVLGRVDWFSVVFGIGAGSIVATFAELAVVYNFNW